MGTYRIAFYGLWERCIVGFVEVIYFALTAEIIPASIWSDYNFTINSLCDQIRISFKHRYLPPKRSNSEIMLTCSLMHVMLFNSLALGEMWLSIWKLTLWQMVVLGNSGEISHSWMPQDLMDDKSILAWCKWTTSHYLTQWWHRCILLYGFTRPQ